MSILEKDTRGLALRHGNGDGKIRKKFLVGMNESREWGKASCQEWCPGVGLCKEENADFYLKEKFGKGHVS